LRAVKSVSGDEVWPIGNETKKYRVTVVCKDFKKGFIDPISTLADEDELRLRLLSTNILPAPISDKVFSVTITNILSSMSVTALSTFFFRVAHFLLI
jgi:hypothetical protein